MKKSNPIKCIKYIFGRLNISVKTMIVLVAVLSIVMLINVSSNRVQTRALLLKTNDNDLATLEASGSIEKTVYTRTPQKTATKIVSITPTIELTNTPVVTNTLTPTPATYPEEYYIEDVYGHRQYFSIGCEAAIAVDWARYYGVEIIEYNFQFEIPVSDNPDLGFVGDVHGPWGQAPPYAYGVHAGPVADMLQNYDLNAVAVKNYSLEELKAQLSNDNPVITWVIGNVVGGVPFEYTDSEGNVTTVAAYEHVVLVTGYNQDSIRYLNNGKTYDTPVDNFLNSWGVLGNMAIVMGEGVQEE